mgnify:CR=1 FL=1
MIMQNIQDVCASDEFKELSKDDVVRFLRKTGSQPGKDDSLLTAAIEWVDFNPVSGKMMSMMFC